MSLMSSARPLVVIICRHCQAYFNLHAYYEFWAINRVEGVALFGTLVLPLGMTGK